MLTPPISLVHIFNVDVKKGRHGFSKTILVADRDQRIADPDLRRATDVELAKDAVLTMSKAIDSSG